LGIHHALVEANRHHDEIEEEVETNHPYRNPYGLPETLEEDRTQHRNQNEGDEDLSATKELFHKRVLYYMRSRVGG